RAKELLNVDTMVRFERRRTEIFEAMALLFDQADFVMSATNPDVAFAASGGIPTSFGGKESDAGNNGALTIASNIYGNPAISIPIGTDAAGLPIGMQVSGPHHSEPMLLELAAMIERERPWPLVA
ncbi:MAG: amidase, partial [Actinomycetia bacterium]|nr:amidase [Actinomycetes bacterium]